MSKTQPFLVPGMVSPSEYNWREQFAAAARASRKDLEPFRAFDVGKVMGLVEAYDDVIARVAKLEEHLALALPFCPKGPVPQGLAPMFYHTRSYDGDVELQNRIDAAREALKP